MSRSERLRPIAGLEKDKETKAALILGESQRRYQDQERRLAELERFQHEYQQQFQTMGRSGAAIQRYKEYREFNERLSQAIHQQRKVLEECRRELQQQNRRWSEVSAKRRALEKAIERFRAEETVTAHRREQRETDDRAQRIQLRMDSGD